MHLIGYIADTKRFLILQYGREKGLSKMVDVYRALPCIKTAEIDGEDSNNLKVVWIDGRIHNITQLPPESLDSTITRDQAIRHVDRMATIYVNGLGKNLYFIFGGGTRMGTHGGFIQTFTPLANAMRTAKDEEDYLSIMKTNQPPGGMSEKTLRLFYRYKDDLPKWDPRKRAVDNPATPATQ